MFYHELFCLSNYNPYWLILNSQIVQDIQVNETYIHSYSVVRNSSYIIPAKVGVSHVTSGPAPFFLSHGAGRVCVMIVPYLFDLRRPSK